MMGSALRVRPRSDRKNDWPSLAVTGEVDLSNVDEFCAALESAVPNSAFGLSLDLSGVTYLDSTGIRVLFRLDRELRERQQRLRIVVPEDAVIRRVLELAGVFGSLDVVPKGPEDEEVSL